MVLVDECAGVIDGFEEVSPNFNSCQIRFEGGVGADF